MSRDPLFYSDPAAYARRIQYERGRRKTEEARARDRATPGYRGRVVGRLLLRTLLALLVVVMALGALAAYLGIGYALWRYLGITWPDPCSYGPNPGCAGGA